MTHEATLQQTTFNTPSSPQMQWRCLEDGRSTTLVWLVLGMCNNLLGLAMSGNIVGRVDIQHTHIAVCLDRWVFILPRTSPHINYHDLVTIPPNSSVVVLKFRHSQRWVVIMQKNTISFHVTTWVISSIERESLLMTWIAMVQLPKTHPNMMPSLLPESLSWGNVYFTLALAPTRR